MDHDAQIARFVSDLNRRLRGRDEAASRLEVVLRRCGWVKKSSQNLDQIQEALETAGIFPAPRLMMRVERSERIRFRRQAGPDRMLFAREEDLRDFLYENFSHIGSFDDFERPQREARLRSGSRIDLLWRSRTDNAYVVIEVKRATHEVVGQMTRYLSEVDTTKAKGDLRSGESSSQVNLLPCWRRRILRLPGIRFSS